MGYILDKKTTIEVSKSLKNLNEKVIFTHGAYDLFHIGHLEFLKLSKRVGDILIVGLESDERIAMYKDIKRPVIPLVQRIRILSKIEYVDFVFPIIEKKFDHEYYLKLYDKLKPNEVTFGGMYGARKTIEIASQTFSDISFTQISHQYDCIQSTTKIIDHIKK